MPNGYSRSALAVVAMVACANTRPPMIEAPVVVPFELRGDFVVVRVVVNGQSTLLILDTGSGAMVLDSAVAEVAGIEFSSHVTATANGSATHPMRIGHARDVRLGAAPLSNVLTAVGPFADVQARVGYDVHGSLGFEVFDRYVVDVDYRARTITLSDPAGFTYRGSGVVVPIKLERRVPVTNATIATRKGGAINARLMLDLGSSTHSLRLATRFVEAHHLADDTITVAGPLGAGVDGVPMGQLLRMPRLTLGGLTIERPSTVLSHEEEGAFGRTAETDGTVGAPVFRRTRMIIDYSRERVIFEPRGRFDVPDSVDASGVTLTVAENDAHSFRVAYVIAGSAAADAGVRVGDELMRIDDTPATSLTLGQARELFRAAGSTRRLILRRDGKTVSLPIALKMVF